MFNFVHDFKVALPFSDDGLGKKSCFYIWVNAVAYAKIITVCIVSHVSESSELFSWLIIQHIFGP